MVIIGGYPSEYLSILNFAIHLSFLFLFGIFKPLWSLIFHFNFSIAIRRLPPANKKTGFKKMQINKKTPAFRLYVCIICQTSIGNIMVFLSFLVLIWYLSSFCQQVFNSSGDNRLFILLSFWMINQADITAVKVWKLLFRFLNKKSNGEYEWYCCCT